jgi:uncharacterized membrane protein YczE
MPLWHSTDDELIDRSHGNRALGARTARTIVIDTDTVSGSHLVIAAIVIIALLGLFISTVVSIKRSSKTWSGRAAWICICLVLPLLGPALWFAFGKTSTLGPPDRPASS